MTQFFDRDYNRVSKDGPPDDIPQNSRRADAKYDTSGFPLFTFQDGHIDQFLIETLDLPEATVERQLPRIEQVATMSLAEIEAAIEWLEDSYE